MADERTVWEKLGIPNPDELEENDEERYDDLETEQDEEAVEEDQITKKLTTRVDDLQKKFDQQMLAQRKKEFMEAADPMEAELFKAVAGDVKDMETLDKTMAVVLKRAEEMRAKIAAMENEAQEKVAKAWGVRPGRASAVVPEADEWEEMRARARSGDDRAAFELFKNAPTSKDVSPTDK